MSEEAEKQQDPQQQDVGQDVAPAPAEAQPQQAIPQPPAAPAAPQGSQQGYWEQQNSQQLSVPQPPQGQGGPQASPGPVPDQAPTSLKVIVAALGFFFGFFGGLIALVICWGKPPAWRRPLIIWALAGWGIGAAVSVATMLMLGSAATDASSVGAALGTGATGGATSGSIF